MEKHIRDSIRDDLVQKACELFGASFKDLKTLDGFESFIYEYKNNGIEYILRLVHSDHRSLEQVLGEIEFINYLNLHGACVSPVVHSLNDELVEKVPINKEDYFSVSSFVKGKGKNAWEETKDGIYWENLGEQIGLFHHLTKDFKPIHLRPEWQEDSLYLNAEKVLADEPEILKALKFRTEKILEFHRTKDNYGLIHTDIHNGNIVVDEEGRLTIFDFDDSAYKHFISDIAIVLFYHMAFANLTLKEKNEISIWVLKHLFKGYKKYNILPREELHRLQDFLKLRELTLYTVIIATGEDLSKDDWAQNYLNTYRDKIINDEPFIDLYYVLNKVEYE